MPCSLRLGVFRRDRVECEQECSSRHGRHGWGVRALLIVFNHDGHEEREEREHKFIYGEDSEYEGSLGWDDFN